MTRWQRQPALPEEHVLRLVHSAQAAKDRIRPLNGRKSELEALARAHGVTGRTLYRYLRDYLPCPGYPQGSCLTKVQGGGLCSFCKRTKAMA